MIPIGPAGARIVVTLLAAMENMVLNFGPSHSSVSTIVFTRYHHQLAELEQPELA